MNNQTDDTKTLNDQLLSVAEEADNVLEAVKDQTLQFKADLEAVKGDYGAKAQAVKGGAGVSTPVEETAPEAPAAPAVTVETTTTTAPSVPTM